MPQDGAGNYQYPPGTPGIPDQTIESEAYNTFLDDLVTNDLNIPRPVHRGGTGGNSADAGLVNLHGEKAEQVVTEYLSHLWMPGSFRSAVGATDAPVAGHTFSGICYINEPLAYPPTNNNVVVEARDQNDTTVPGRNYIREKKAGTWGPWVISDGGRDQVVTDYNTHLFYPGTFRSATTATNSPVSGHAFAGFCYLNEPLAEPPTNANLVIEARDQTETTTPGPMYVREKRANVWSAWRAGEPAVTNSFGIVGAPGTDNSIFGVRLLPPTPGTPSLRWELVLGDASPETGGNAGSNYALRRYNDAGVLIDAPMTINRATGIVTFLQSPILPPALSLRGYIDGMGMVKTSPTSITINPGNASDSTNAAMIVNAAPMIKTTATWSAGSGGGCYEAGAVIANMWGHWYAIRNPTTGAVDFICSDSPTTPILPSGFTQFRIIGTLRTDPGAATWLDFIQDGDKFMWGTPRPNPGVAGFPATAVLRFIETPPGRRTNALLSVGIDAVSINTGNAAAIYISDPTIADVAPHVAFAVSYEVYAPALVSPYAGASQVQCMTNMLSQVRSRCQFNTPDAILYITTYGWWDQRGKNG